MSKLAKIKTLLGRVYEGLADTSDNKIRKKRERQLKTGTEKTQCKNKQKEQRE